MNAKEILKKIIFSLGEAYKYNKSKSVIKMLKEADFVKSEEF